MLEQHLFVAVTIDPLFLYNLDRLLLLRFELLDKFNTMNYHLMIVRSELLFL